jgi:signal transduction histidine kinase/purine-cytosine permease-like protein/DNA-binding NarL/FixJ family response regulator
MLLCYAGTLCFQRYLSVFCCGCTEFVCKAKKPRKLSASVGDLFSEFFVYVRAYMANIQKITRVRRQYNQWVANQTLEDYALRFTAKKARKWSAARVGNTALGAISFLALEAIGGAITLNYGFYNAFWAIVVVGGLLFLTGLPITYYAARYGLDIDLLSRGAGFGYIGSTITSLIYASFTFIFFAIEAAIMSMALEMVFGIPLFLGYLISAVVVIPLVTHGITFISRLQLWTQPIWIGLHLLPFIFMAYSSLDRFEQWTRFEGYAGDGANTFNIFLFGAAGSVLFSLIAQIGEQVDYLRFMPEKTPANKRSWWWALLCAGPGWIGLGALKILAGSFLTFLALSELIAPEIAAEPSTMYLVAFQQVTSNPQLALALMGIFVIVSQIKINVTNAYAGSIAWSNFFSRLTHSHPGRVVWLVFNVMIACLLMEMGIYKALEQTLGMYSMIAVAWVGALVADLVINKPFGLSPPYIEFKRAHLYDINPVGVGAMAIATMVAFMAYAGIFGETAAALSSFLALGVAFVSAPLIALLTKGRFYIARPPQPHDHGACCLCENTFEKEDTAYCPVYGGTICSLCCSLDSQCNDACKPNARFSDQILGVCKAIFPKQVYQYTTSQVGHYLGMHMLIGIILACVLLLLYSQTTLHPMANDEAIANVLWKAFVILMIVSGVVSWLFVLAKENRRVAQEESIRQTAKLHQEIAAHKVTDDALQKAKEMADAANTAKSRYITGLAHELRTPLNAIYGYAQLLEKDAAIPDPKKDAIAVIRRNSDHLARLIDGIADISKIEARRLRLVRNKLDLHDFLNQIETIFNLQAASSGVAFSMERPASLPHFVYTDEKRLRQIIINLLSNAIKFTSQGSVLCRVRYRSEVAEFDIVDTGQGIAPENLERIFHPFERCGQTENQVAGLGLGLAITKVLTEVMGGEITVQSKVGRGSTFKVKLFLPEAKDVAVPMLPKQDSICGYRGRRRTILVADDTPEHRGLLEDILVPLGFVVHTAVDGRAALKSIADYRPDLILLDVSMPFLTGWQVARIVRKHISNTMPIVIISANNRHERILAAGVKDDNYLMKPISVPILLDKIENILGVQWVSAPLQQGAGHAMLDHSFDRTTAAVVDPAFQQDQPALEYMAATPPAAALDELYNLGKIGHIRAIQKKLDELTITAPDFVAKVQPLVQRFEIDQFMQIIIGLKK